MWFGREGLGGGTKAHNYLLSNRNLKTEVRKLEAKGFRRVRVYSFLIILIFFIFIGDYLLQLLTFNINLSRNCRHRGINPLNDCPLLDLNRFSDIIRYSHFLG